MGVKLNRVKLKPGLHVTYRQPTAPRRPSRGSVCVLCLVLHECVHTALYNHPTRSEKPQNAVKWLWNEHVQGLERTRANFFWTADLLLLHGDTKADKHQHVHADTRSAVVTSSWFKSLAGSDVSTKRSSSCLMSRDSSLSPSTFFYYPQSTHEQSRVDLW